MMRIASLLLFAAVALGCQPDDPQVPPTRVDEPAAQNRTDPEGRPGDAAP